MFINKVNLGIEKFPKYSPGQISCLLSIHHAEKIERIVRGIHENVPPITILPQTLIWKCQFSSRARQTGT